MTEDEEAALLAEYGVNDPLDGLLTLPAASTFRSDFSGPHVFLTGAHIVEDGEKEEARPSADIEENDVHQRSLMSFLVHKTPLFRNFTSSQLLYNTMDMLNKHEKPLGEGPSCSRAEEKQESTSVKNTKMSPYYEVLQQAKKLEASFYCTCAQEWKSSGCTEEGISPTADSFAVDPICDDGTTLLAKVDRILEAADKVLLAPRHVDPNSDEIYKNFVEYTKREMKVDGLDEVDDYLDRQALIEEVEEKEISIELVRATRKKVEERLPRDPLLTGSTEEREEDRSIVTTKSVENEKDQKDIRQELLNMEKECLYSYEWEPTREEIETLQKWDHLLTTPEELPGSLSLNVLPPPEVDLMGPLMDVINEMKEVCHLETVSMEEVFRMKEEKEEDLAVKDVTASIALRHRIQQEYQRSVQVELPSLAEVIARTLPSIAEVPFLSPEGPSGSPPLSAATSAVAVSQAPCAREESKKSLLRRSKLHLLLLKQEEKEFGQMRSEDTRSQAIARRIQEQIDYFTDLKVECMEDEALKRNYVLEDEKGERKVISSKKVDHWLLTLKAIRIREVKASEEKAEQVMTEYKKFYEAVEKEEASVFVTLLETEQREKGDVIDLLQMKEENERKRKQAYIASLKASFQQQKKSIVQKNSLSISQCSRSSGREFDEVLCTSPIVTWLSREKHQLALWCGENVKKVKSLNAVLSEVVSTATIRGGKNAEQQSVKRVDQPSPVTDRGSSSPQDNHQVLDAECMARLLPLAVEEVQRNPQAAAQWFFALPFSLEHLSSIDYGSLADWSIHIGQQSTAQSSSSLLESSGSLCVGSFVREVDLSSNSISTVHIIDLLAAFPFLKKLNLAQNGLQTFMDYFKQPRPSSSIRGVSAAQVNALSESVFITDLDVSSNNLSDVSMIGKYMCGHIENVNLCGNQLTSLDALASCARLRKLNASKNLVRSLDALSTVSLLGELNVGDCKVESIASIVENNFLIEKLYLSRNPLSKLPSQKSALLFLSQLFVNECGIESLSSDSFPWLPHLTVLHANANKIDCISGLVHCRRLTMVQLADNRIDDPDKLAPLAFCKRLSSLDLRRNPLLLDTTVDSQAESEWKPAEETLLPPSVEEALLHTLPSLRELNNCLVPSRRLRNYVEHQVHTSPCIQDALHSSRIALQELCSPISAYREAMNVISNDIHLRQLEASMEALEISGNQRFRAAEALEDELRTRYGESKTGFLPLVHRFSHLVEAHHRSQHIACLSRCFSFVTAPQSPYVSVNHHVVCTSYAIKQQTYREKKAKRFIAEWLYGRLQVQQARLELKLRREEWKASQAYRLGESAKLIQRVGRGSIFRHRLRSIQQDDLDLNFDEALVEGLDLTEDLSIACDFKAIVGNVMKKVQPHLNDKFEVPDSSPLLVTRPLGEVNPRAESAPNGVGVDQCRLSESQVLRPSTHTKRSLEDDWGRDVALRIAKKNEKRLQERQKKLRVEYINDPLHAKRQLKKA